MREWLVAGEHSIESLMLLRCLSAGESRHVQRNTVSLATYPGRKHRPALLPGRRTSRPPTFPHVVLCERHPLRISSPT